MVYALNARDDEALLGKNNLEADLESDRKANTIFED